MFRCLADIEFFIINDIFFFLSDGVTYIGGTEMAMSMAMVCRFYAL